VYKNNFKDKKKIKIAVITNIPTPYRKKQWEFYAKCKYLDITIFYCANKEKGRFWDVGSSEGVKEVFLKGITFKYIHFNPGILKIFSRDYDIFFVGGYGYPSVLMSLALLRVLRKPWVMLIDGISPLKLMKGNFLIEKIKKLLISGANAYSANGTVGIKYLELYGISSEKIFNQYMTVDVDYFMGKSKNLVKCRFETRQKYNLTEDCIVVMYAGRLIEDKGVQDLIEAVKNLKDENINIKALIVGDGTFKSDLKRKSEDIKSDIIFTGHIKPEELYKYYYASDIFILPTYSDLWGLVVNEAMACGLPVIVTDAAGCSLDLVRNNGIIIKKGDVNGLYSAIKNLIENDIHKVYGKNSLRIIKNWKYENSLNEFLKLINFVLKENR